MSQQNVDTVDNVPAKKPGADHEIYEDIKLSDFKKGRTVPEESQNETSLGNEIEASENRHVTKEGKAADTGGGGGG